MTISPASFNYLQVLMEEAHADLPTDLCSEEEIVNIWAGYGKMVSTVIEIFDVEDDFKAAIAEVEKAIKNSLALV